MVYLYFKNDVHFIKLECEMSLVALGMKLTFVELDVQAERAANQRIADRAIEDMTAAKKKMCSHYDTVLRLPIRRPPKQNPPPATAESQAQHDAHAHTTIHRRSGRISGVP